MAGSAPSPRQSILLVDDDRGLVDMLSMALEDAGYVVDRAHDGKQGWQRFSIAQPDLVVLDLLMPEMDGLELCKRIRAEHATPIVMLTSRDEEMDKVLGLEMGADDYVTKPFSVRELVARIRAALRRAMPKSAAPETCASGELHLDRARHQATMKGVILALTATEFELLWALLSERGRVLGRERLMSLIYGDIVVSERTLDTFVKRIRRKLHDVDPSFDAIETVRSVGYRFKE
jgi:two-component system, OmpR family, response regulator